MIRTEDLTFSYKTKKGMQKVFQELNVSFTQGLNVILGPNGAGKSTLLKSVFGLLKYSGDIRYKEKSITKMTMDERTKLISYLPQTDASNSSLTVLEMVLLGRLPELGRRVKEKDLNIVMETLSVLNIEDLASRYFSELSGGQKKMVFIAQTLVRNPKIILLDEPVNSLDLQKQLELCRFLKDTVENKDISIVVVLHDINLAARFADYIVILDNDGGLYSFGTPKEVINKVMLEDVYGVRASIHYDNKGIAMVSAMESINRIS